MYELTIEDLDGKSITFAEVPSVEAGRALWRKIAGVDVGQTLAGFTVWADDGTFPVYSGNYVSDAC